MLCIRYFHSINTALSGGGVYIGSYGIIDKQVGGTIYGYANDTSDKVYDNVVKDEGVVQSSQGHAVYVDSDPVKRREKTAGPTVRLDSSRNGSSGGWE